mgnify:CR=1 FL=1
MTTCFSNQFAFASEISENQKSENSVENGEQDDLNNGNDHSQEEKEDEVSETESSEEIIDGQEQTVEAEESKSVQGGEDAPYGMKINLLDKPYGVTKDRLSFSWTDSFVNNMQNQSAYRIVISKRENDASEGIYIYDTDWVESSQNTSVLYDLSGILEDNELYYWQVQIKNEDGEESSLSEVQAFTTEVGDEWKSQKGTWGSASQKVVMFRSEIDKPEEVEKIIASVTATSAKIARQYVYDLYINGQEVGMGPLRQNGNELYYNTYDITDYTVDGKNVIGSVNYSEGNSAFLCQITCYMKDGSSKVLTNSTQDSSDWKVLDSDDIFIGNDMTSIGTWAYVARRDNLNANKYPGGWEEVGYHSSEWKKPVLNSNLDSYQFVSSQMDNMKRYEILPASVTRKSDSTYIVDMGKEIIGGIQLNLQCSERIIKLDYGEELNEDGSVKSRLNAGNLYQESWTLKSGTQKIAGIGMKTFRYVQIANLPDNFSSANIIGLMIRTGFDEENSDFQSSNKVLNDVYELSKYTSKATTQDVYVDSQNRERLPYEGDALITAMNSYSYSATSTVAKTTAEYLLDNTTWPAEYSLHNITMILQNYMYTGDKRTLASSYEALKSKTLENYYDSSEGLMKDVVNGSVAGQQVMTDWPAVDRDGYNTSSAYYNTVFNAVCSGAYADMAKIAEELGYEGDRAYYQNLSDTIKQNMIAKLYNAETGKFWDGLTVTGEVVEHSAQHATAYALAYGIYTDQTMADQMCNAIENDGELKVSLYSSYFLLQGLYNSNHGNLARKIMSNPDAELGVNSWSYMMYGQGATITTEFWNNIKKTNMSTAHAWGTAPGSMLIRGMFGIQPLTPGFDTFQIKIQPGGLQQASVKVPTMKGEIKASYALDGTGAMTGEVTIPANSKAVFTVPCTNGQASLIIDGEVVAAEYDGIYFKYELGSGTHTYQINAEEMIDESEWVEEDVVYSVYGESGWTENTSNRSDLRHSKNEMIEAIRLHIKNQSVDGDIQYAAYMQESGWQEWKSADQEAGIPSGGKRLEAFRVLLTGELSEKYDVYYRVHAQTYGWLDWAKNGESAGTEGLSKRLESIQIVLVEKDGNAPGSTSKPFIKK